MSFMSFLTSLDRGASEVPAQRSESRNRTHGDGDIRILLGRFCVLWCVRRSETTLSTQQRIKVARGWTQEMARRISISTAEAVHDAVAAADCPRIILNVTMRDHW